MVKYKQLNYRNQLALLKLRGITGIDLKLSGWNNTLIGKNRRKKYNQQIHSLKMIGYYNIKEYCYFLFNGNEYNISFDDVIKRYYRDKRFKNNVLQAIEDIEVAVNTQLSYILGEYGPFGYKKFYNWCQTNGYIKELKDVKVNKYFIEKEQLKFFSNLQYKVKKSNIPDIVNFEKHNNNIFPPVWLMVNLLTMGDTIHLIKLLNKNNRIKLANSFNLKVKDLISYLECLNLIRNICCHNGNLVDLQLRTKPSIPNQYEEFIFDKNTNGIVIPLIVIKDFITRINNKYNFTRIIKSLESLISFQDISPDFFINKMGFKDKKSILKLFKNRKIINIDVSLKVDGVFLIKIPCDKRIVQFSRYIIENNDFIEKNVINESDYIKNNPSASANKKIDSLSEKIESNNATSFYKSKEALYVFNVKRI